MIVAVRVGGDDKYLRALLPDHFRGVCVNAYSPAAFEKPAPLFICVTARDKAAAGIGAYRARVSAGLFPFGIFFEQARDAAEAYDGGAYLIHS